MTKFENLVGAEKRLGRMDLLPNGARRKWCDQLFDLTPPRLRNSDPACRSIRLEVGQQNSYRGLPKDGPFNSTSEIQAFGSTDLE